MIFVFFLKIYSLNSPFNFIKNVFNLSNVLGDNFNSNNTSVDYQTAEVILITANTTRTEHTLKERSYMTEKVKAYLFVGCCEVTLMEL
jgi:hypothetical protein